MKPNGLNNSHGLQIDERVQLTLIHGDVVHEPADVLVNTANSDLDHNGGLGLVYCMQGGL